MSDRVPNAPLREAFLRSGKSPNAIARALGMERCRSGRVIADDSEVRRMLGLRPTGGGRYTHTLDYGMAVRFAGVLGVDPFEVGL